MITITPTAKGGLCNSAELILGSWDRYSLKDNFMQLNITKSKLDKYTQHLCINQLHN